MLAHGLARLRRFARRCIDTVRARVCAWTTPRPRTLATGLATDLVRRRHDLLLENAFLRQQVIVLSRGSKRPTFTPRDRALLVLLASRLRTWASALLLVQPETLLRWHRGGFRLLWRRKSAPRSRSSQLAAASGIAVVRTPVRAPRANAVCERFLRSVRRECLDHVLLLGEAHLRRNLGAYVAYFNRARPHQGLGQRVPVPGVSPGAARHDADGIIAVPVLGGLHHTYQRAA